jgi:uncharacterized protein (TIGR00730 family)
MGAADGQDPEYIAMAEALGTLLGRTGKTLVYGGATVGLMGRVAAACLAAGGKVIGVTPDAITSVEGDTFADGTRLDDVATVYKVRSMERRKAQMMSLAEGYIVLPGGGGTMAEAWPVLDTSKLQRSGMHPGDRKPVVFLAPDDFFDGTMQQIRKSVEKGFMKADFTDLFRVARSPEEALMRLEGFEARFGRKRRVGVPSQAIPAAPPATVAPSPLPPDRDVPGVA